jgi:hypothetical protein
MDATDFPKEQLPGYTLGRRIGSGGYGEVWSAQAPGGIAKAIKYVYGSQLEKRATHELHALEKIKSVRHPFLLSLDRIEVIDGRLLVVSELADGSLRDRFRECLAKGMVGIPREELLGYLADAADALDFLSTQHGLAHLDVKPENLLLVAGHVKVADFGLVKSISTQSQASLVGGMTPTYAAPEVFRGCPSRCSDQYSLAILYQEMLTGTVPFAGMNAAELTLQHMNHDPDLTRLGTGDRFACARALSKEDTNRFESASAFVAALRGGGTTFFAAAGAEVGFSDEVVPASAPAPQRGAATEVFDEGDASPDAREPEAIRFEAPPLDAPESVLRAIKSIDLEGFRPAPALFLGIGGTASRVLRTLRCRLQQRLGAQDPLATLPMLLLDTDRQTLAAAARGTVGSGALDAKETIALPLRRPQEYRDKAPSLLRWLGRRWLYNIPRSMTTEGIRPLGRLALVDNARRAFQCVRSAAVAAISDEARSATLDATGIDFRSGALRVYVIASASGGTGSGVALDVGYAVKSILDRLGVADAKVIGVMTHSAYRDPTRGELARVNTYAWLSEFCQFATSTTGYPGDEGCGLPPRAPGEAAFDETYLVPLGEHLDAAAFETAAESVGEYILADVMSPAQRVLDAARGEQIANAERPLLRTFAVVRDAASVDEQLDPRQRLVVQRLLTNWLRAEEAGPAGEPSGGARTTDAVVHGAVAFLGRTQLEAATIASTCRASLEAAIGGDASAFLEARQGAFINLQPALFAAQVDRWFAIDPLTDLPTGIDGASLERVAEPISKRLANEIAAWALGRVNDPAERLLGAGRAAEWCVDHVRAVQADLHRVAGSVAAERARWIDGWESAAHDSAQQAETIRKLFRLRLDQASLAAARAVTAELFAQAQRLTQELDVVRGLLVDLASAFSTTVPADEAELSPFEIDMGARLLEDKLQHDFFAPKGGLLAALATADSAEELRRTISHAARQLFPSAGAAASCDAQRSIDFAPRPWADCGGEHRRLVVGSSSATLSPLVADATVIPTQNEATLLVTEGVGMSLPHVATDLVKGRRDYTLFAERVRTRRDTPWVDAVASCLGGSNRQTPSSSSWSWADAAGAPSIAT